MEFIRIIQSVHSPFLDSLAQVITMLGEDTFFIVLAVVMIWCVNKKSGWRLGLIALSSGALNAGLKQVFKIERPIGQEGIRSLRLETAGGYSFPSGHSQFTASVWTKLATLINQTWFYVVASIIIVLVGLSRIYLGVHFLTDVLAGLLIGIAWALVFDKILDFLEQKPLYLSLFGVLLVISLPFFPVADYYKVAGTIVGLVFGYLLEQKYVNFKEKAPFSSQIVKVLIGLLGVFAIKNGLKIILPSSLYSDAFRYMLIGIWTMAAAPYLFNFLPQRVSQDRHSA